MIILYIFLHFGGEKDLSILYYNDDINPDPANPQLILYNYAITGFLI